MNTYTFQGTIWLWNNGKTKASWHFVTVSQNIADQIKQITKDQPRKGRGSIKVEAMIGYHKRTTSIFPDKKSGSYLLPIKAAIRKSLSIQAGNEVSVQLKIII